MGGENYPGELKHLEDLLRQAKAEQAEIRAAFAYMGPKTQAGLTLTALAKGAGILIQDLKAKVENEHEVAGELQAGLSKQYAASAKELDEKDAEIARLRDEVYLAHVDLNARLTATVHALGGIVEGNPTGHHNYLQRIRELRAIELQIRDLKTEFEQQDMALTIANRLNERLQKQLDLTLEWLEAQDSAAAQVIAKRVRIETQTEKPKCEACGGRGFAPVGQGVDAICVPCNLCQTEKRKDPFLNGYRCLTCDWVSDAVSRPLSRGTKVGCPKCNGDAEFRG